MAPVGSDGHHQLQRSSSVYADLSASDLGLQLNFDFDIDLDTDKHDQRFERQSKKGNSIF